MSLSWRQAINQISGDSINLDKLPRWHSMLSLENKDLSLVSTPFSSPTVRHRLKTRQNGGCKKSQKKTNPAYMERQLVLYFFWQRGLLKNNESHPIHEYFSWCNYFSRCKCIYLWNLGFGTTEHWFAKKLILYWSPQYDYDIYRNIIIILSYYNNHIILWCMDYWKALINPNTTHEYPD